MTVSTINSVAEFVTNGTTNSFPFYFKFLDGRDLVVTYINPEEVSTILTMGTQYTVSGAGNDKGGSISTTTALLGPGKLIVSRDMEAYQQISLRNQGKFLAETHEDAFDKLTMLSQQGFAVIKRALSRPLGREYFDAEENRITGLADPKSPQDAATKVYADGAASGAISYTDARLLHTVRSVDGETLTQLPAVASRANKVMGFDANGQPIGVLPASGSGTEVAIDLANGLNTGKGAGMVALPVGTVPYAIRSVTPEQFGCSVSAIDNRSKYQAALDYSALHGLELVSNGDYDVSGPLYLPQFNLVWRGSGKVRNTYSGDDGQRKLCFYPGTYNPVYFDMLSYSACDANQYGQAWIKFTTISEASQYSLGELVFIRSLQHYNGADGQIPLYGSNNRITAIDTITGVVHLEYPILRALTNPRMAKTGNTGILDVLGEREIYCCYNARIDGISFESINGHVTERGGMLGCSFNIPSITGLSGVYTNAVSFSMLTVGRIDCDLRGIEMAGCTTGSVLDVGTLVWRKSARSVAQAILSINENMASSVIKIRDFSAPEFDYPSQPLIHVLSAQENVVRIERLTATMASGTIITFENLLKNGPGESQPSAKGNSVFIGMAIGGANLQRFCHMTNPGRANAENVTDGYFVGSPTVAAVTMAGDAQQVRGDYSAGAINLNVATNSVVDAKAAGGVTGYTRSANNKVLQNTAQYESKPKILSSQVTAIGQLNGASGAVSFTPDLSKGSVQAVPFTSALSLAINNPVGASEGDSFILVLTNNNSTTAIIPNFGAAFILFGEAIQSIAPGKRAMYRFSVLPNFAYVLELQRVGFT